MGREGTGRSRPWALRLVQSPGSPLADPPWLLSAIWPTASFFSESTHGTCPVGEALRWGPEPAPAALPPAQQAPCSPGTAGAALVGAGAQAEGGRVTEEKHMHGGFEVGAGGEVFQVPEYSSVAGEVQVE